MNRQNILDFPVLDIIYTRKTPSWADLFDSGEEASLPFASTLADFDVSASYAPHWAGINLDRICCGMSKETPGLMIAGDSYYTSLQLASYISAYHYLSEIDILSLGACNSFFVADNCKKYLMAVCNMGNILSALDKNYAGYFITDFFDYDASFTQTVMKEVVSTVKRMPVTQRPPIIIYAKPAEDYSSEYNRKATALSLEYEFECVKVGNQTCTYLERLINNRAKHYGLNLNGNVAFDDIVTHLIEQGYGSNDVEYRIEAIVKNVSKKGCFGYFSTADFLFDTPESINERDYTIFSHDNYYDLFDYSDGMEDTEMNYYSLFDYPLSPEEYEETVDGICIENANSLDEFVANLVNAEAIEIENPEILDEFVNAFVA